MRLAGARCEVFCFKEGLLSRVGHDLRIEIGELSIELTEDHGAVEAHAALAHARVACARVSGRDAPGLLSPGDVDKIERAMRDEVLELARHPVARFRSTRVTPSGEGYAIEGELELHGARRPLRLSIERAGDRLRTTFRIHQPDFGLRPFAAPFGVLKVKPELEVHVSVPAPPPRA